MVGNLPSNFLWTLLLSFPLVYVVARSSRLTVDYAVLVRYSKFFNDVFSKLFPSSDANLLLTRSEVEQTLSPGSWQRKSFDSFAKVLLAKSPVDFPCVYATKGFKAHEHLYLFIDSEDPSSSAPNMQRLSAALGQYISKSRGLGPNTSLVVLTPLANPSASRPIEEYHASFWNTLNGLAKLDGKAWPTTIPRKIDSADWRFCYSGEQLFAVALTPAHEKRRSRHADCFCMLFQPKWVLDALFSTPAKKTGAINRVRGLLTDFDDVAISPELKSYGEEGCREYKQYFILDDNSPAGCPFATLA